MGSIPTPGTRRKILQYCQLRRQEASVFQVFLYRRTNLFIVTISERLAREEKRSEPADHAGPVVQKGRAGDARHPMRRDGAHGGVLGMVRSSLDRVPWLAAVRKGAPGSAWGGSSVAISSISRVEVEAAATASLAWLCVMVLVTVSFSCGQVGLSPKEGAPTDPFGLRTLDAGCRVKSLTAWRRALDEGEWCKTYMSSRFLTAKLECPGRGKAQLPAP